LRDTIEKIIQLKEWLKIKNCNKKNDDQIWNVKKIKGGWNRKKIPIPWII
jgi:hypothetical protein